MPPPRYLGAALLALLASFSCRGVSPTSAVKDDLSPTEAGATSADDCGAAGQAERRQATFARTTDCAVDALSAGFAAQVQLAGEAVQDTKTIVDTLTRVATAVGANVNSVSSANAILCVRTLTGYVTAETVKNIMNDSVAGLTSDQNSQIVAQVTAGMGSTFSAGVTDVFTKGAAATTQPNVDNLTTFLMTLAGSVSNLGQFVTTCGSVAAEFGEVALPSVSRYATAFANIGVVTGIAKCSMAVVGNAVDVGRELRCFGGDLAALNQQYATLMAANNDQCAGLADLAAMPHVLDVIQSDTTTEVRANTCYALVHRWGSCLYTTGVHSCGDCRRLCTGYVNGAGPNAFLQPVIDEAMAAAGASDIDSFKQVLQIGLLNCPVVQADRLQPCINFCRGQYSDPACQGD